MNASTRLAVVLAFACSAASAPAAESAPPAAPAAARIYPFVGTWSGRGELSEPGQKPVPLSLGLKCSKASSGWAVRCEMTAKNGQMVITETDLMGVDPVTGQGHWYAVTNQGETHDHVAEWTDASTMKARHEWTQDGKRMGEDVTLRFGGRKSLEFRSVTSADGQEVARFSGTVTRR